MVRGPEARESEGLWGVDEGVGSAVAETQESGDRRRKLPLAPWDLPA